jgi:hypothetical protein
MDLTVEPVSQPTTHLSPEMDFTDVYRKAEWVFFLNEFLTNIAGSRTGNDRLPACYTVNMHEPLSFPCKLSAEGSNMFINN